MPKKKQLVAVERAPKKRPLASTGMDIVALFNEATRLGETGEMAKVPALYRDWVSGNSRHPQLYAALFNLGVSQMNAGDNAAAEKAFLEALECNPGFLQGAFNLGSVREKLGRGVDALASWELLTALSDESTGETREMLLMGLNHSGRVLEGLKRFEEAEQLLARSLRIDPVQPKVIHHWVHLRQKQGAWPVYAELPGLDLETMQQCTSSLAMLDVSDDPAMQMMAARRFVAEHITPGLQPLADPAGYGHKRLRVGYLSSDFCLHPVSMLMVELLEQHDRSRVEVYGYCWSREDGSDLRRRVIGALDHHVPIGGLSDEAAAARIRADEIDVLVDLHGPTAGARPDILARRPAVVQISYLGFPGTSGMACIDYILCDRYVLPEATQRHMTEKPLFLPEVFQVCDSKRAVGPIPSRQSCGLPAEGFVFCSFNNSHKYTPEMFNTWVNILKRVPGSVLWLVADNPSVKPNLLRFCAERGIGEDRLVFASRVLPPEYLARYMVADLFLDCFPFNGGTTANDALWMGLPLLTLSGRGFASRMAGSLLRCLGLEELIAGDLAQYEDLAVELGHSPERLAELKRRLAEARDRSVLFRTDQQARHIEDLFFEVAPGIDRSAVAEAVLDPAGTASGDAPRRLDIVFAEAAPLDGSVLASTVQGPGDQVALRTQGLVYTCHTHVPLWVDFPSYVQPIFMGASQKDGCGQLNLRDLAPQWDEFHPVVGGSVASFAFKNYLLKHHPGVRKVGICQYRKFVSRNRLGTQATNFQVMDVVPSHHLPQDILKDAMLPSDEDFLLCPPGRFVLNGVEYGYLYQYKDVEFVEDLLRFVAEAVELGVLHKNEVVPLFEEKVFFPGGIELGFFPADFWIPAITAIEEVTWACLKRFDTRREGSHGRFWGYCGERLGSYLLLKQLRSKYGDTNWPARFLGYLNLITEGEEAGYKPGI